MQTNKIIGYILLGIGILLIIFPLWHTYNIFNGYSKPTEVFKKAEISKPNTSASSFDMQAQIQEALLKVLPVDFFNNILNLLAWIILMWVLIYGGGKIADIGIKLLKS